MICLVFRADVRYQQSRNRLAYRATVGQRGGSAGVAPPSLVSPNLFFRRSFPLELRDNAASSLALRGLTTVSLRRPRARSDAGIRSNKYTGRLDSGSLATFSRHACMPYPWPKKRHASMPAKRDSHAATSISAAQIKVGVGLPKDDRAGADARPVLVPGPRGDAPAIAWR